MKKLLLILMLVAVAASTLAHEHSPDGSWKRRATAVEAAWHRLQFLKEDTREHLALHGISSESYDKLVTFTEQAVKDVNNTVRETVRKACANPAALKVNNDLLIKTLRQTDADEARAAAQKVMQLFEVIGQEDAEAFIHMATSEDPVTIGGIDYATIVNSGKADVDRYCDQGEVE
jgi:hypothetical protein